ncbi:MAG TPA: glutathione S-transferase family protein [Gammaproteobacteria bacterium]|nr:glutathione S-transferase family protein [Gammaproteobacteria bacterium]
MAGKPCIRLITIPMSHYCEKARWGLERLGIEYHEERHLQVFHYPRTFWFSGGPNVPVLIDGVKVVHDSTAILEYLDSYADADRRLYPLDSGLRQQVSELEDLFDEVLGVESRRWVYYHFRSRPMQALRTAGQGTPLIERLLLPVIYPLFVLLINRLINPSQRAVEEGLDKVRALVKTTDSLLAEGHRYLLGDQFTAADLSLACMLAPLVVPRNYGIRLPEPEQMPVAARPVIDEFRATATGAYVLKLFATEKNTV